LHPLLTQLRALAAYLLAWAVAAGAMASLVAATGPTPLAWALVWAVPLCGVLAIAALSPYFVCQSQPVTVGQWPRALATRAALVTVLAAGSIALALAWNALGGLVGRESGWVELPSAAWALGAVAALGVFSLSVLAHDLLIAFRNAQVSATREAQARVLARDMELQVLRMQIDPHFLFNSLNAISALTSLDPGAARDMSIDLAHFFRQTLALADRDRIRLSEELGLIDHYLAVEKRRLGDRLQTRINADAASLNALLPPLTLQPLFENAIKHGLRHAELGGCIELTALVRDGWLHLALSNPVGAAPLTGSAGLGLGLRNLRERLAARYRHRAHAEWGPSAAGFTVQLSLPHETE
jgi:hypothetical protein